MLQSLENSVNFLITSCVLDSIAKVFQGIQHLDIRVDPSDVQKYIESRIRCEAQLTAIVTEHPTLQEDITKKIIENVQGMYVSQILSTIQYLSLTVCKGSY
jgi:hypothetical protein